LDTNWGWHLPGDDFDELLRDHVRSHFPEASWYVTVGVEFMAFMIVYIFTVFVLSRLGSIPVNRRREGANTQADEQS